MTKFSGYPRPDGRWGVRNHCLVLPTSELVNRASELIEESMPEAVCLTHFNAAVDSPTELHLDVLANLASNPNVGQVVLLGMGDDADLAPDLERRLQGRGVPAVRFDLLSTGSMTGLAEAALPLVRHSVARLGAVPRRPAPISELVVGTECGGSDAYSGLTANPAVGVAMDMLVAAGGTAILAETTELIGAEHLLAARAATPEVAADLLRVVGAWERMVMEIGEDIRGAQPTPGNQAGGLTTIEEKSLGAATKGGTTPLMEVVEYGRRPARRGLVVMDTPGHDIEQLTGMAAGGCQLVVFTTGRGTPTASPVAPTVKIATNHRTAARIPDHIDLGAGGIATGEVTKEEMGRRIFERLLAVASGELTKAERFGQHDFALPRTAPSWR